MPVVILAIGFAPCTVVSLDALAATPLNSVTHVPPVFWKNAEVAPANLLLDLPENAAVIANVTAPARMRNFVLFINEMFNVDYLLTLILLLSKWW